MILLAAAWATARSEGEAAEAQRDWPAAVTAYQGCVATGSDVDVRFCATRLDVLEPHARDGFAGWTELETVRREYRTLGSDAALARVEAALVADPDGPAAAEMKAWIAHERQKRGEPVEVEGLPEPTRDLLATTEAAREDVRRRRYLGLAGLGVAGFYGVFASRRGGPVAGRSALVAAVVLGLIPALMAAVYGGGLAAGFLRAGAVLSLAVLVAPRVPVWMAAVGTIGALVATAWWNDWLP